ncbi:hypothetical protein HNP86_001090 [Methanococcus maripaludis]|uniref:Uncharacterized protein n=2 Tax=Methanococcus maripaludis TaxID=39152 RepID=A0A7J9NTG0_METMI|nr:hypothetical protein [Methanococcus maripaludis]AEK19505.1 hypothetical protein GYY_03130 [Methanococcus maripaludis X1]MBA2850959.1 hypothetical protein [Methanococcus maripaludis]
MSEIKYRSGYEEFYQRRIVLDRIYVTIHSPLLRKTMGNGFEKAAYERMDEEFPRLVTLISEKRHGRKTGDYHFRTPVETWSKFPLEEDFDGEEIASIAISFRQPHVARGYFNLNRLYMKKHNIDPYEDSYHDNNVLPIEVVEDSEGNLLREFAELLCDRIEQYKFEYAYYLKEIMDVDIEKIARQYGSNEDIYSLIEVSIQSAEIDVEWLNCESLQFQHITDERKQNYMKAFGNLTNTEYYTPERKSIKVQFKRYQKGAGINRHEFTWNGEASRQWLVGSPETMYYSIVRNIKRCYAFYGFDFDSLKPLQLTGEDIVQDYAEWWHLPLNLVKTILFGRAFVLSFDFATGGLRERLKSRGLITPLEEELGGKKGLWRWKDSVLRLKLSLQGFYRCECGFLMRYDPEKYQHVCEHCGKVDNYSQFEIGSMEAQKDMEDNISELSKKNWGLNPYETVVSFKRLDKVKK